MLDIAGVENMYVLEGTWLTESGTWLTESINAAVHRPFFTQI